MTIKTGTVGFHALLTGLLGGFFFTASSPAATSDSYDSMQGGYSSGQITQAPITGPFSGTLEPDSFIELSDLTSFDLVGVSVTPKFFSL